MTSVVPWIRLLAGVLRSLVAWTGLVGRRAVVLQPVPVPVRLRQHRG